jgi:hypothetical protein
MDPLFDAPAAHRWRRFLRFSLRGLMVLVLLPAIWLGWLVRSASVQRKAVAAITRAGAVVRYDFQWKSGDVSPQGRPPWPKFLVDSFGVDYFCDVTWVQFLDSSSSDEILLHVGRLERVESLVLVGPQVTDRGLFNIERLKELRILGLFSTGVTDAGIARLTALPNLEHLEISHANVTDGALGSFRRLTSLRTLFVRKTKMTGAGLQNLHRILPQVEFGIHSD